MRRKMLCMLAALTTAVLLPAQEPKSGGDTSIVKGEDYDLEMEAETGVTVTGTRTAKRLQDSPIAVEVITTAEIEHSGASTVVDVLDDYGLVYTGNGMGDYVQMQGMGKNRILYLINGRRVSGRIAQRLKGETLPLANVDRIEIIRGPQSALYGSDALGGVINIITKRPTDKVAFSAALTNRFLPAYNDPETAYAPGPFDDFNPFREQDLTSVFSFPLGLSRNSVDLEASRGSFYMNEDDSASLLPRYYRGRLGLDSSLMVGDRLTIRFGGSGMLMRRDDQTTARGSLNRLDYLRADGFAEADYWLLPNLMLNFRLYDNYYQRNRDAYSALLDIWTTGERFENDNIAALEMQGILEISPRLLLITGLEGAFNSMKKYNLSEAFVWMDREALFSQLEFFVSEKYSLIGGVRFERNSQFGFVGSPKVSGMLYLGHGFRVFAGTGLGYRAPDFSDLYLIRDDEGSAATPVYGNPDLAPEYSLGTNLGIEYARGPSFFQLNTYYNELFNEIGRIYIASEHYYETRNISRSLRVGMDMEGKLTLWSPLFVSAGYSWLYAWDRSSETELFPQPNHMVKMKLGLDIPRLGMYTWLQGRFFSKFRDPTREDSHARFILDFYFSIKVWKNFDLNFGINNITGEMDRIGPETAQTVSVGLKYTL